MSNSLAAAVLTTPDPDEAMRAVRTLLEIAEDPPEVDLEALIRTPGTLERVREVLPGLEWSSEAGGRRASWETGEDPAAHLPLQVLDWSRPLDRVEPFIEAMGAECAAIRWDLAGWPEVPGAGLDRVSQKHAYLTLSLNCRDLYQSEPSGDHTVHVHVASLSHRARIEWLAGQVGGAFTGRTESAYL
ncbi:hypothetical protein ABT354_11945 [Streptomyces sp. NPDC000594]|uniref:hypothetical protein n=1 Tax=Streptomyces sp. NPDC000594 TaxID=3154261 RepID=UPI003317D887